MYLLKDNGHGDLSLLEQHENTPPYAILSHTWGADGEEVTFKDLMEGSGKNKAGYKKIEFCRNQAARDGLEFFWVDTCCIDKSSSAELSEAINSMFRWYQNAEKCYAHLSDVSTSGLTDVPSSWEVTFQKSRWFSRGWTLQELIAPASVEFFSSEGDRLGSKRSLEKHIHKITGIPVEALRGKPLMGFEVEERFSWAKDRQTKRQEDKAYSLFGIFSVHLPLLYGEGSENAFMRLREEIVKSPTAPVTTLIPLRPAPVEQSETPPPPSSTVPFRRDVDFVDRAMSHDCMTLLEYIEQRCRAPASRVALVGMGGAGKSQLGIEYCYRLRERSPNTWVFWIHASNLDRIAQGYREIAERVKIPGRNDPNQNIFELVTRWLQDDSKGTWMLVLDNLDDDDVLAIPPAAASMAQSADRHGQLKRPLSAYLPQSQNGALLITTRTRSVATKLVEPRDVIMVEPMTEMDATTLLKKKLDMPADDGDLQQLACILEYMPLAVVQAAAYIQQKGAWYSVQQYIEAFQRNEKKKTSLLNHEAAQLRRDPEAKNSIIVTWQMSFDDIREKWPSSADLLSLMSYFDRQGIPKEVLTVHTQEEIRDSSKQKCNAVRDDEDDEDEDDEDDVTSTASNDDLFEEAMDRLRSYAFVSLGKDKTSFEMHGLVQLATRKWLAMRGEDEKWKALFNKNLNAVLPNGKYENWDRCEVLFPHTKSAERQRPVDDISVQEWAAILRNAGWYARARGYYHEAERMCEKSVRALRKIRGEDDVETSYSLGVLASLYSDQGRWTEAEQIQRQIMKVRQKTLGEEHPDTLESIHNLALIYLKQGRWTETEQMQIQLIETKNRIFGEGHPRTLDSVHNLALIYSKQGRWAEAEKIQMQMIETRQKTSGREHPDTLTSMNNLVVTYLGQGRWTEAERMNTQVMKTRQRILGEEHPDTLMSMSNLATIYSKQGRWAEAEQIEIQVMKMKQTRLGEEHPETLISMGNMAMIYSNQGQLREAERMNIKVMTIRQRILGEEHPQTLISMNNMATIYTDQGRLAEAEKIEIQVMEMRQRILGQEHPDTLRSMNNLAFTLRDQGRKEEAINLMAECVQLRNRVLGTEHPEALSSAGALAEWQSAE